LFASGTDDPRSDGAPGNCLRALDCGGGMLLAAGGRRPRASGHFVTEENNGLAAPPPGLLRKLFRKERVEREPARARRHARTDLGGIEHVKEEVRAARTGAMIEQFSRDVRVAVRSLLRNRTLTATVVVTLALGIGANAAVFSVVRGVLLRPLINRDEERLI